jgi:hypothetical protein
MLILHACATNAMGEAVSFLNVWMTMSTECSSMRSHASRPMCNEGIQELPQLQFRSLSNRLSWPNRRWHHS